MGATLPLTMSDDHTRLREKIQTFLQLFGPHEPHTTPCGQPLSVPQAHALMRLKQAEDTGEGGMRILQLGEHLSIDKSNVSRLCVRMETEGQIERRVCPDDGRAKRLWLTEEGRRVAREVDRGSLDRFARICGALGEEERVQVIDSLQILNEALRTTLQRQDPS